MGESASAFWETFPYSAPIGTGRYGTEYAPFSPRKTLRTVDGNHQQERCALFRTGLKWVYRSHLSQRDGHMDQATGNECRFTP